MKKEREYTGAIAAEHIKKFGQYFTKYEVASFMCSWACSNAKNMLDPAVGNSIFFNETRKQYPDCKLYGYELDSNILSFFGNPFDANITNDDYLLNDWDLKFDAIVCNPPYCRFQSIQNRDKIIDIIFRKTNVKYSAYTNMYIFFLIKSIYQLSEKGRLAYIIPTEFLNSKYGTPIKEKLLKEQLLRAVINFKHNDEMFFNATTTCCILLIDKEKKEHVEFYNLDSYTELNSIKSSKTASKTVRIKYEDIDPYKKWRPYLHQEKSNNYINLTDVGTFCHVTRGIATGANDFFCMSKSKIEYNKIPNEVVEKCVCRSADIKTFIFREKDFNELAEADKTVYILNIKENHLNKITDYISKGELEGINKKYLLTCRHPWYSMEKKPIAPIWVSSACRNGIKFVRNLANVNSLTTFHSIFISKKYEKDTDIIFCYFITPIAQSIIRENRKELGNGLEKFQPSDMEHAKMLNIDIINQDDRTTISNIYKMMIVHFEKKYIEMLNNVFLKYIVVPKTENSFL